MRPEEHWLVIIGTDSRECFIEDGCYIHCLNTSFRISTDDPRIDQVKPCGTIVAIERQP